MEEKIFNPINNYINSISYSLYIDQVRSLYCMDKNIWIVGNDQNDQDLTSKDPKGSPEKPSKKQENSKIHRLLLLRIKRVEDD